MLPFRKALFDIHVDGGLLLVNCTYNHGANNCLVATKAIVF